MTTAVLPRAVATRIDPASHVREDAMFIPSGDDEMFCVLYRPRAAARRGIVFCCSLFEDALKLYRPEVLAARACAALGWAAIRFHYRGTGHSGGEMRAATLQRMCDDAQRAADLLAEHTGAEPAACGARWGGVVAGLLAYRHAGAPLALWEPAVSGREYMRNAMRVHQLRDTFQGLDTPVTAGQLLEQLHAAGRTDVLGYQVYREFYESLDEGDLARVAAGPRRPVLLAQVAPRERWRPEFTDLQAAFTAGGSQVDGVLIGGEDPDGWLLGAAVNSAPALGRATLEWLRRLEAAP